MASPSRRTQAIGHRSCSSARVLPTGKSISKAIWPTATSIDLKAANDQWLSVAARLNDDHFTRGEAHARHAAWRSHRLGSPVDRHSRPEPGASE